MPVRLVDAMRETLSGWHTDPADAWQPVFDGLELGFDAADASLEIEPWEPIFPCRRGRTFPGAPEGAHMFRAFDAIHPGDVRCVILGQDPYPAPDFSTGRAFEAGNVAQWRELDKMFSKSVRAFIQLICAVRSGNPAYAGSFADWPRTLADIESGVLNLEPADALADRWVSQGVLLLNSSLTLSRFLVQTDAHQSHGHMPIWRPLILRVLTFLEQQNRPLVVIAFGDVAARILKDSGQDQPSATHAVVIRKHPAEADIVLADENPFAVCNQHLEAMGAAPIAW